ncbi:hypothetical protein N4297_14435, partial [Staphylococcus aureus]|nr:hypothetical protein [Staphylococcus aureus]
MVCMKRMQMMPGTTPSTWNTKGIESTPRPIFALVRSANAPSVVTWGQRVFGDNIPSDTSA